MKITKFEDPWPHLIIDDTWDETLLHNFIEESMKIFEKAEHNYYDHFKRMPGKNVKHTVKLSERCQTDMLLKHAKALLNSGSLDLEKILHEYFPIYREYKNLTQWSECLVCWDKVEGPLHTENPTKILSCVTYCDPEVAVGTLIYDKDKNFVKEVEWKRNRSLIFAGLDDTTWHRYKAGNTKLRLTLNNFLSDRSNKDKP